MTSKSKPAIIISARLRRAADALISPGTRTFLSSARMPSTTTRLVSR